MAAPPSMCFDFQDLRFNMRQAVINPKIAAKKAWHNAKAPFTKKKEDGGGAVVVATNKPKPVEQAKKEKSYKFKYRNKKKLAQGGFGTIYRANCLLKGEQTNYRKECAMKVIPTANPTGFLGFLRAIFHSGQNDLVSRQAAEFELQILKDLQLNEFILHYEYDTFKKGNLVIVTELCKNRDLAEILEDSSKLSKHKYVLDHRDVTARFECDLVRFVCAPIFDALAHMHEVGYIHRDIKPQNILVDTNGVPKLCDFGLAVKLKDKTRLNRGENQAAGSSYYMAPETIAHAPYTITLDTWQMGISMLVLTYGWGPYHFRKTKVHFDTPPRRGGWTISGFYKTAIEDETAQEGVYTKRIEKRIRDLVGISKKDELDSEDPVIWRQFRAFVAALLKINVRKRPTCRNVCEHEYIRQPLDEWKSKTFVQFNHMWTRWLDVLNSCGYR